MLFIVALRWHGRLGPGEAKRSVDYALAAPGHRCLEWPQLACDEGSRRCRGAELAASYAPALADHSSGSAGNAARKTRTRSCRLATGVLEAQTDSPRAPDRTRAACRGC